MIPMNFQVKQQSKCGNVPTLCVHSQYFAQNCHQNCHALAICIPVFYN